eukprot:Skav200135  [mRNA]  locus=scaffold4172:229124:231036:- [translate_table: standard]
MDLPSLHRVGCASKALGLKLAQLCGREVVLLTGANAVVHEVIARSFWEAWALPEILWILHGWLLAVRLVPVPETLGLCHVDPGDRCPHVGLVQDQGIQGELLIQALHREAEVFHLAPRRGISITLSRFQLPFCDDMEALSKATMKQLGY